MAFGRADWRGMLQSANKRDFLRYITYLAERSQAEMRKNSDNAKEPVTYQTFIIDMEELSMRQMAFKPCKFRRKPHRNAIRFFTYFGTILVRDFGVEAIKMSEANYPESLRRVFIINGKKMWTNFYLVLSLDY